MAQVQLQTVQLKADPPTINVISPRDYRRHVLTDIDLEEIWPYNLATEVQNQCLHAQMRVNAIYRFCAATLDGQLLRLYDRPKAFPLATLRLASAPKQTLPCLTTSVAIYIVNVSLGRTNTVPCLPKVTADAAVNWLLGQIHSRLGLPHSAEGEQFNDLDHDTQKSLISILRPTPEVMESAAFVSGLVLYNGILHTSR